MCKVGLFYDFTDLIMLGPKVFPIQPSYRNIIFYTIFSCLDMKVVQAFPCRCRFADKENAPKVEEEVSNDDLSFVIIFNYFTAQ